MTNKINPKRIFTGFLITFASVIIFACISSYTALKGESPNDLITPLTAATLLLATFSGVFYTVKASGGGLDGIITGVAVLATVLLLSLGFGSFSLPIPLSIFTGTASALFLGVKRKKTKPKKRLKAIRKKR